MARPIRGEEPINVSFTCKMTETESERLRNISFSTGLSKSEVVRRAVSHYFALMAHECYKLRKKEDKENVKYTFYEMQNMLLNELDDIYFKYIDPDNLIDSDDVVIYANGTNNFSKFPSSCLDEKSREEWKALKLKEKQEKESKEDK